MQSEVHTTPQPAARLSPGDLLTETEAAMIIGASVQTLRNWRWKDKGPRYRKVGARMVRYYRADLQAFIEEGQPRSSAQDSAP